jgi:electron transfer flavoprotein alpha subunit
MAEILVLVEHRDGDIRDITWEMLACAGTIGKPRGDSITAVLLGSGAAAMADAIRTKAHAVVLVDDERLGDFNSETHQPVLASLIDERKPCLTLIGHTACGMDLAPSLATALGAPLVTDCTALGFDGNILTATRQMYGGKVDASMRCKESDRYLATIRSGVFSAEDAEILDGEVATVDSAAIGDTAAKRFLETIASEAGEVDIAQADLVVGVGRGIKDQDSIKVVEDFADAIGAVLACSRPVVDKKWLPKDRQVGTSGKTIKPKLYMAIGISGTFQHVAGIKGAGMVVAINKDPKAPIFNVADYGIVDDLFKVIPALQETIVAMKG